jgi:hypothetical protein
MSFCSQLYRGWFQVTGEFYRLFLCLNENPLASREEKKQNCKARRKMWIRLSSFVHIVAVFHLSALGITFYFSFYEFAEWRVKMVTHEVHELVTVLIEFRKTSTLWDSHLRSLLYKEYECSAVCSQAAASKPSGVPDIPDIPRIYILRLKYLLQYYLPICYQIFRVVYCLEVIQPKCIDIFSIMYAICLSHLNICNNIIYICVCMYT